MRSGFSVPNGDAVATVEAVIEIAKRTLWTFERIQ
jgi:hypothetical protein